jgi:hypothetical protein
MLKCFLSGDTQPVDLGKNSFKILLVSNGIYALKWPRSAEACRRVASNIFSQIYFAVYSVLLFHSIIIPLLVILIRGPVFCGIYI